LCLNLEVPIQGMRYWIKVNSDDRCWLIIVGFLAMLLPLYFSLFSKSNPRHIIRLDNITKNNMRDKLSLKVLILKANLMCQKIKQ